MVCFPKYIVFLVVLLFSSSVSAQHNHDGTGEDSTLSFVEMMISLQTQLEILTRSVIVDDFGEAHDAAYKIATHEGPSLKELQIVMKALGGKAESFEACDKKVHDLAMKIAINAHNKDGDAMVNNYTDLVKQVRTCHLEFREIVQNAK